LIRAALVNGDLVHGGVERQIAYIADRLKHKTDLSLFMVYYQARSAEPAAVPPVDAYYIPWYWSGKKGPLKFIFFPLFFIRFLFFCLRRHISVLHGFGPLDNLTVALAGIVPGIKSISSIRTSCAWALRGCRVWAPLSEKIVSNSRAAFRLLAQKRPVPAGKQILIRNGIDLHAFPYRERGPAPRHTPFTFLLVGRISPSKNHRLFIAGFHQFLLKEQRALSGFRIVFCGPVEKPSYLREIRQAIKTTGLERITQLMPYVSDIRSIYEKSDCLILPSRTEGLPNVLLEAMAVGLPWIASDIADVAYLAGPLEARGHVFEDNNRDSLCRALQRFFSTKQGGMQARLRRARNFVEGNFGLEVLAKASYDLYKAVGEKIPFAGMNSERPGDIQ
jgi:glycosyltransferase involved in cell wall biosynthesis